MDRFPLCSTGLRPLWGRCPKRQCQANRRTGNMVALFPLTENDPGWHFLLPQSPPLSHWLTLVWTCCISSLTLVFSFLLFLSIELLFILPLIKFCCCCCCCCFLEIHPLPPNHLLSLLLSWYPFSIRWRCEQLLLLLLLLLMLLALGIVVVVEVAMVFLVHCIVIVVVIVVVVVVVALVPVLPVSWVVFVPRSFLPSLEQFMRSAPLCLFLKENQNRG